jgi:hypothetical protein
MPSAPTLAASRRIFALASGAMTQRVRSKCSVKAIDGTPSSTARAQDRSIEPAVASQDHSVWT